MDENPYEAPQSHIQDAEPKPAKPTLWRTFANWTSTVGASTALLLLFLKVNNIPMVIASAFVLIFCVLLLGTDAIMQRRKGREPPATEP